MPESGTRLSLCLAAAIFILVICVSARILALPLVATYWTNQQKIVEKEAILSRYQAMVDDMPLLEQRLADQKDHMDAAALYLSGPTAALAGTELQDMVSQTVAEVGGKIESTETLPTIVADNKQLLDRIGLRANLSVNDQGLGAILYNLESRHPYLSVGRLVVIKKASDDSLSDAGAGIDLDVAFDVFGFLPK